ncbi:hypothetical protein MAR_014755 [Mya arenaria]|uniref:Uncharacterized protein n=1 Tax=Mya arenaria TaxID=6604 RepID=A0ABY7FJ56_MYAAR|nr:hypothetical protein MAR_014727 [Mya arenaria]WAR20781.1 hypothetical protein MAR_014755 [Mya arenaria]
MAGTVSADGAVAFWKSTGGAVYSIIARDGVVGEHYIEASEVTTDKTSKLQVVLLIYFMFVIGNKSNFVCIFFTTLISDQDFREKAKI